MDNKLKIIYKQTKELKPYANNPRINDDAVEYVANSIKEFGFKVPMVITSDGEIVAGHTRLKACERLGITEVPCVIADDLTPEQIKAFRLADNKVGEIATWDVPKLEMEMQEIEMDMTPFGFEELGTIDEQTTEEDDFDPSSTVEPRVQRGEVWLLGRHRLMCGDATSKDDIQTLTGGVSVDLIFTDPPYGMKKASEGIVNDNLNFDDLLAFNEQWIPLTFDVLKNNGSWYCWSIDEPLMDIYSNILRPMKKLTGEDKLSFRNLITWDKSCGQGQLEPARRSYATADEKCLFVMRGRQTYGETKVDYWEGFEPIRLALIGIKDSLGLSIEEVCKIAGSSSCSHWFAVSQWEFPSDARFKTFIDNLLKTGRIDREEYERIREEYDRIREEWYSTRAYFDNTHDNMNNVWHFERTGAKEREDTGGHATPKPIALCARAIKSSSRVGESVLDVFGGSGSTLIACEQLDRICYMLEIDPHYCDVIIARWEKYTGNKAVKA